MTFLIHLSFLLLSFNYIYCVKLPSTLMSGTIMKNGDYMENASGSSFRIGLDGNPTLYYFRNLIYSTPQTKKAIHFI